MVKYMCVDVIVGVFLFGGIDFMVIVVLVIWYNLWLIIFIIGFECEGFFEIDVVVVLVEVIGVCYIVKVVSVDEFVVVLFEIVWYFDELVVDLVLVLLFFVVCEV